MAFRVVAGVDDHELVIRGVKETGKEIGRGAYGTVFEVEYYGVLCAAKKIHPILIESTYGGNEMKESFRKECHLSASLRHPNIVSFLGIFYDNDQGASPPALVSERMQYSLRTMLEKYENIPMYVKVSILYDVSAGLSYLHGNSILHRCLCSNDILLGQHLVAKISDFGAAVRESNRHNTKTRCPGVVDFMPPEALNTSQYSFPLDVFSYGGVMLHTITQQWPHPTAYMEFDPISGKKGLVSEVERRRKYFDILALRATELQPLAVSCLDTDPKNRPLVTTLLSTLKAVKSNQANDPSAWLTELSSHKAPGGAPMKLEKVDIPSILHSHVLSGIVETGKEIGHGSYGVVHEVNYNGKLCAAKQVHSIFIGADGFSKMRDDFVRECHLWSTLLHPNVVQFLGVYYPPHNESGLPTLVMEKMWDSLTSLAENYQNIPLHVKISILTDVAFGLRYLHSKNPPVIHCDLSPNNVLVGFRLEAKITDLGVARAVKIGSSTKTMTKAPGTTDFMPPEAVSNRPMYGPPLDIFSYGGIILHIITQQWPRPSSWVYIDPQSRKQQLLNEVERREHYLKQVTSPKGLNALATSCLNGDPEKRPVIKTVSDAINQIKDDYGKENGVDWRDLVSWLSK